LGADVFAHFRAIPQKYRTDACLKLLATDDWREYINDGVCEYCGVAGLGQPHTISVGRFNGAKHLLTGAPVPIHDHTRDDGEGSDPISETDFEDSWCEWAYVIDPFKQEIEVISKHYGPQGTFAIDADFDAEAVEKAAYNDEEDED
jgi:hypothetical protein